MPFTAPFDPARIAFGPKDGKFARTALNDSIITFKIGDPHAPMRAPFGISEPYNGEASDRLTMDLELTDPSALAFFRAVDDAVIKAGVKHSVAWFGKPLTEPAIAAMHTPLVKESKNPKYPPTLRTKVNVGSAKPTLIYIYKGPKKAKTGSQRDIERGSFVSPYVSLSSVMFGNRQFGVSLTCEKMMVVPMAEEAGPSVFGDFELEEDEPKKKKAKPNDEIDDEFDDDEDDDDE